MRLVSQTFRGTVDAKSCLFLVMYVSCYLNAILPGANIEVMFSQLISNKYCNAQMLNVKG